MSLLSIKDYAAEKGISYEAVRKQVNRYKIELEEHISIINRTQYLDDEAIAFLDQRRQEHPVVVVDTSKDEEIQQLEEENRALLLKLTEVQDKLVKSQEVITLLQNEKLELQQEKIQLLEERIAWEFEEEVKDDEETEEPKKSFWRSLFWKD